MWIALIDHSGSMGGSFQGESEFAGRSKQSRETVKLNAANRPAGAVARYGKKRNRKLNLI